MKLFSIYLRTMTEQLTSHSDNSKMDTYANVSLDNLRNMLVKSVKEYQNIQVGKWIRITDPVSTNLIMNAYGDTLSRQILNCVASVPDTVMSIVSKCAIPQTTGYSKIMGLMELGFLIQYDMIDKKGKMINRYISIFKELQIHISENQEIVIRARLSDFL